VEWTPYKFKIDEKVEVKWTDGFYYQAQIIKKLETGYEVNFIEFNENYQATFSQIKALHSPKFFNDWNQHHVSNWLSCHKYKAILKPLLDSLDGEEVMILKEEDFVEAPGVQKAEAIEIYKKVKKEIEGMSKPNFKKIDESFIRKPFQKRDESFHRTEKQSDERTPIDTQVSTKSQPPHPYTGVFQYTIYKEDKNTEIQQKEKNDNTEISKEEKQDYTKILKLWTKKEVGDFFSNHRHRQYLSPGFKDMSGNEVHNLLKEDVIDILKKHGVGSNLLANSIYNEIDKLKTKIPIVKDDDMGIEWTVPENEVHLDLTSKFNESVTTARQKAEEGGNELPQRFYVKSKKKKKYYRITIQSSR